MIPRPKGIFPIFWKMLPLKTKIRLAWVEGIKESERYKRKGFSPQSLSDYLPAGMPYSRENLIYAFRAAPKDRMGKTILTNDRGLRSNREIEIDICSRALTAIQEELPGRSQQALEVFTRDLLGFRRIPPLSVAEALFIEKRKWEKPNVKKPLSFFKRLAWRYEKRRRQEEKEQGLYHELLEKTPTPPLIEPFGQDLVPYRFEAYDAEPPGYSDPPPIEMLLDLERKFKDFTEINISPELLELLKSLMIYPSCKSLREAVEILGWNEKQYQRAKKNLQRNRSLLASILKK
jgi:hypothetical protein